MIPLPEIKERIPAIVIGTSREAHTAYCPHCRWIGIFPTMSDAAAGGIEHAKRCERP